MYLKNRFRRVLQTSSPLIPLGSARQRQAEVEREARSSLAARNHRLFGTRLSSSDVRGKIVSTVLGNRLEG